MTSVLATEVHVCLKHAPEARRSFAALACEGGLDKPVILRVQLPRRYGGGGGVGQQDQLPLNFCFICGLGNEKDGERSESP